MDKLSLEQEHEVIVELSIENRSDFSDLSAFLASSQSVKTAEHLRSIAGLAKPFDKSFWGGDVRNYLEQNFGIKVPNQCDWPTYMLDNDDPDEWEVLIEADELFIHFHWSCPALRARGEKTVFPSYPKRVLHNILSEYRWCLQTTKRPLKKPDF